MTPDQTPKPYDFTHTRETSKFLEHILASDNLALAARRILAQEGPDHFWEFVARYQAKSITMPSPGALNVLEDHTVVAQEGDQFAFIYQDRNSAPPRTVTLHSPVESPADFSSELPEPRFRGETLTGYPMFLTEHEVMERMLQGNGEAEDWKNYHVIPITRAFPGLLDATRETMLEREGSNEEYAARWNEAEQEARSIARRALEIAGPGMMKKARELLRNLSQDRQTEGDLAAH